MLRQVNKKKVRLSVKCGRCRRDTLAAVSVHVVKRTRLLFPQVKHLA